MNKSKFLFFGRDDDDFKSINSRPKYLFFYYFYLNFYLLVVVVFKLMKKKLFMSYRNCVKIFKLENKNEREVAKFQLVKYLFLK